MDLDCPMCGLMDTVVAPDRQGTDSVEPPRWFVYINNVKKDKVG